MSKEKECKSHKWIPLAGKNKGKKVPTALFTCLKCGDLKVGTHTIKISKYRMDMGELPINSVAGIKLMNSPTADLTASGLIMTATVDTNAQGIGAPLFMAADGHLDTADADTNATSPCVALAMETGTGSKKILVHGVMRVDAWNWTIGPGNASLIYVSTSVGTLTQTVPFVANNVFQPVGWALTADSVYFSPTMLYLTIQTWYGERGIWAGGINGAPTILNTIDYVSISSTGNATDFGDITVARHSLAGCSDSTTGIFGGGDTGSDSNVIDYVTIATTGNASDFGDLLDGRWGNAACSNGIRGFFINGRNGGTNSNVIQYVTIQTTGNTTDFGDSIDNMYRISGFNSQTRAVWGMQSATNAIEYCTMSTLGNSSDFGDTAQTRYYTGSASDQTRGLFSAGIDDAGPTVYCNTIEYITISTTGNSSDFGDLADQIWDSCSCSGN